jgi:DNA-binding SARP family transcriptional activator
MIEIGLLQGTFILRCNGARITLRPMEIRVLLALYCAGGPVESSRLVELLWHMPTQGSHSTLRTHIRRIREKVSAASVLALEEFVITTTPVGGGQWTYELASGIRYDAAEFSALASSGFSAFARGEYQRASDQLSAALALWGSITGKDQILAEAAGRPFALKPREKYWQMRKDVGIGKAEAEVNIGLHRQAAADLTQMARDWPQDLEIAELRVLALHRCGRTEEASEVCAILTARDAGIDDRSLRKLQQSILTGALPPRDPVTALPTSTESSRAPGTTGRSEIRSSPLERPRASHAELDTQGLAEFGEKGRGQLLARRSAPQPPSGPVRPPYPVPLTNHIIRTAVVSPPGRFHDLARGPAELGSRGGSILGS